MYASIFQHLHRNKQQPAGGEERARSPHAPSVSRLAAEGPSTATPTSSSSTLGVYSAPQPSTQPPPPPPTTFAPQPPPPPAERRRHPLPHVQSAATGGAQASGAASPPAAVEYTSLEGLRKTAVLHSGKHSTVCSYLDTCTGLPVAVKTYFKKTMAKRHFRNVRREITISRLLSRQRFSGAVRLLGAFEDEGHVYLVQESCGGGDLYRRLVRSGGVLSEEEACRDVVVPLLLTLSFLHASHICHRDIKPENIFFTADGGLRLGDFGLAIDARLERPTSRVGTLDYMAPEVVGMPSPDQMQRLGLAPDRIGHYSCKVDVWAVGVLAYELVCGRPPFEVEDVRQTEQRIQFSEARFPSARATSPLCRSFIQQALAKRPESRPSAAQLMQHPWVRPHYQAALAAAAAASGAAGAQPCAAQAQAPMPQLRRTVSQPPSPSKSMPAPAGGRGGAGTLGQGGCGSGSGTPRTLALPPFLPLSQVKIAHMVRLLSPSRPPSGSRSARGRRRLSDPVGRAPASSPPTAAPPAVDGVEEPTSTTPPPAAAPTVASDGAAGSVVAATAAAADAQDDDDPSSSGVGGGLARQFETPGTPGLQTTPLHRLRPPAAAAQQQQQRTLGLGRTPFLLPLVAPTSSGGSGSGSSYSPGAAAAASGEQQQQQQQLGGHKSTGVGRSRFASGSENDEAPLAVGGGRAASFTRSPSGRASSFSGLPGRASSLTLAARSGSFTSTSFGGSSSSNLSTLAAASSAAAAGSGGGGPQPPKAAVEAAETAEASFLTDTLLQRLRV